MDVHDIVPVLQGFSNAYAKIASVDDPKVTHTVRITGVDSGSADLTLEVVRVVDPAQSLGMTIATVLATEIVKKIVSVIRIKRHVQNQPHKTTVNGDGGIVINNSHGVSIEVTKNVYQIFSDGTIDSELGKLVQPLREDHIDEAEISTVDDHGEKITETITVAERDYFDVESSTVTTSKEVTLEVELVSMNKDTNSGRVRLSTDATIPFKYIGGTPKTMYGLFSYDGPLRITCIANIDALTLEPTRLDVTDAIPIQSNLFNQPSKKRRK